MTRDKSETDAARARISSQMAINEKVKVADVVVDNSSTKEDLNKQVNALIQHYEEGEVNHTTDEHLTELRKKRVHLKDDIYSYLQRN